MTKYLLHKTCAVCGAAMLGNNKRRFCSDACRQKWYRQGKAEEEGRTYGDTHARAKKTARTKATQRHEDTCKQCGRAIVFDGNATRRRYCSDRCRQAAYRARHEAKRKKSMEAANQPLPIERW